MRFTLVCSIVAIMLGCGIVEAVFPIEWPQRYIEREVQESELIGKWEITAESQTRVNDYFHANDNPLAARFPWRQITLREDYTCEIDFEELWAPGNSVLTNPEALSTCTWRLDERLGYNESGSMIEVPGVFVRFEYFDEAADIYHVDYSEAYIADEENELILWNFIGDPLSAFLFQDFQRADE